jgi:DNA repair protein RecN (Recombination protein N)
LSKQRELAAAPFAEAVTERLRLLALSSAVFSVAIERAGETEDGADAVEFRLAPNPGEPPRPLARAASGGELSRTMLAVRVVLSEAPPTLVFDEVDAGIGGEAGVAVGRALSELGGKHQVLVVTHLAQVAAFANDQIAVEKSTHGGRTTASATCVDDASRVVELARMIAGARSSSSAREHATELLELAAASRSRSRATGRSR